MNEINLGEKVFTTEEIERGLRSLPSLISSKAVEVAEKEASVKQMKHAITLVEAATTIAVAGLSEKKTATEMKARGYMDSANQRAAMIELEKDYEIAKAEFAHLRDFFDSVRKAANLMLEERKTYQGGNAVSRRFE